MAEAAFLFLAALRADLRAFSLIQRFLKDKVIVLRGGYRVHPANCKELRACKTYFYPNSPSCHRV